MIVFAFPLLPRLTGPLTVVSTGPVNTSEGNDGAALLFRSLAAAAPVTVAVSVSVPDFGVAVAFALVLLLALLPDDEHAPTVAASATAPARTASFLIILPMWLYSGPSMTR